MKTLIQNILPISLENELSDLILQYQGELKFSQDLTFVFFFWVLSEPLFQKVLQKTLFF